MYTYIGNTNINKYLYIYPCLYIHRYIYNVKNINIDTSIVCNRQSIILLL